MAYNATRSSKPRRRLLERIPAVRSGRSSPGSAFCALILALAALASAVPATAADSEIRPRIVGGSLTSNGQWPSVVAILLNRPGFPANLRQFCAGTLIDPNWVLTAAHCLTNDDGIQTDASLLSVMYGKTDLEQVQPEDETAVLNGIAHPDYVPGKFLNDIALLELAQPIDAPVSALYSGNPESLVEFDALIVGWGAFEYNGPGKQSFDGRQRQAVVPIVSRDVCNASTSYDGQVVDGQFCAGYVDGGIDSCAGDSGGPLFVGFQEDDRLLTVQVGVVSYGNGCALPDFYGVYTDISAYEAFIDDFVQATYLPRRPNDPEGDPDVVDLDVVENGGGGMSGPTWLALLAGAIGYRRARRRFAR